MTEFVFSMNYFFWLLDFKDGSFSEELKQGLLGARLISLLTSSETWKWVPWQGDLLPIMIIPIMHCFFFPFKTNDVTAACGAWVGGGKSMGFGV